MKVVDWQAFRRGVIDGLTGGPIWCLFGKHKWYPRVHPQQYYKCCRCGTIKHPV